MEESAAAAAMVLAYAGEVSLWNGVAELMNLVGEVARAADDVGIPLFHLLEAADVLSSAEDAAGRNAAVAQVKKEADVLKIVVESRQRALFLAAASLKGAYRTQRTSASILARSEKVWRATSGFCVGVLRDAFAEVLESLALADAGEDEAAKDHAIADLIMVAMKLEKAVGARLVILARGAANLAAACLEHKRVGDAIRVVRRAAETGRAQRGRRRRTAGTATASPGAAPPAGATAPLAGAVAPPAGAAAPPAVAAWWPWMRCIRGENIRDLEKALLDKQKESAPPAASAAEQSQVQETMAEKTSGSQAYALYGSLSLLPGFGGKEGLLKSSDNSKFAFTYIFCSWWSSVAMGVPSSIFPHTPLDIAVAHLTSRVGIVGINVLVILYTCWLLETATLPVVTPLLLFVLAGHIFFAIWHYKYGRGDK